MFGVLRELCCVEVNGHAGYPAQTVLAWPSHTLSLLSASAMTSLQSPSPHKLQVVMQLLKALTPATGSAHASSHSCLTGSLAWPDLLLRIRRGRAGSSSMVVLLAILAAGTAPQKRQARAATAHMPGCCCLTQLLQACTASTCDLTMNGIKCLGASCRRLKLGQHDADTKFCVPRRQNLIHSVWIMDVAGRLLGMTAHKYTQQAMFTSCLSTLVRSQVPLFYYSSYNCLAGFGRGRVA
jgi:hypothetical protein